MAVLAALVAVLVSAPPAAAQFSQSQTTVVASPSSATVGQTVLLTVNVTCAQDPSRDWGVVIGDGTEILVDGLPIGPDGTVQYQTAFATPGAHLITAVYNGNDACGSSFDETVVNVSEAPTPPGQTPTLPCLLACGALISFNTGDIHNEIDLG
ncbi:Ig-like domain repeat protein [Streptomyces sp. GC420]|nr:Ig-like domain repeat protein [Streptomyces sp. GC420]